GWSMDDHHPAGFRAAKLGAPATIFHHAPSPYGIPYGCLVSRNVANLMFAGRNASCTHAAMSSTRVMGTGCSMGQAAGTAAALAIRLETGPSGVADRIGTLQQLLLRDDAYLPGVPQQFGPLTTQAKLAASQGDPSAPLRAGPEPLRDGTNRPVGDAPHRWPCRVGDWVALEFAKPQHVTTATVVLDSALHCNIQMSYHQRDDQLTRLPDELPRAFRIEGVREGGWVPLVEATDNRSRLVRVPVGQTLDAVRFTLDATWGADGTHLYAFYLD
ncbi:MAG: FAD-dependent oxidoreductase, partial [Planctomycetes bacterium]|nr:FAD-dependent oxidoreductase [Planctomycetota bacterium]